MSSTATTTTATASSIIELPVSMGEAMDKLSILEIKCDRIKDARVEDCKKEFDILYAKLADSMAGCGFYYDRLLQVNTAIWDKQDAIRAVAVTDATAMSYATDCLQILDDNDRRFQLKKKINTLVASALVEQKGYAKKTCFIETHLGMGDMINMIGAVRYLATMYDSVTVMCKENYIKNVRQIYADDPSIAFFEVCSGYAKTMLMSKDVRHANVTTKFTDIRTCGYHMYPRITRFDTSAIPGSFYDDLKVPRSAMQDYFYMAPCEKADKMLAIARAASVDIVFTHSTSTVIRMNMRRYEDIDINKSLVIDSNMVLYPKNHPWFTIAYTLTGQPIHYYTKLLEAASAIYCVDSSFFCLANLLQLRPDAKKVCYMRDAQLLHMKTEFELKLTPADAAMTEADMKTIFTVI